MFRLSKGKRRFLGGMLIAVAIGAAFCIAAHLNLFYGLQLQAGDVFFKAAKQSPRASPDENIIIVAIDDKSLSQLGLFKSWPRSCHARLIDALAEAGSRAIVFDVLFSEPSSYDGQLAQSMEGAGSVVLPFIRTFQVSRSSVSGETVTSEYDIRPLPAFAESALAIGHANMLPDEDGVVRRLPLLIGGDGYDEPSLSLATVAKYLRSYEAIESEAGDETLPFAGRSVSLDSRNNMLINYLDESSAVLNFVTVSYVDVLEGNVSPEIFRDKIAIIGATAAGMGDTFWAPTGQLVSGVEIHASAVHTILNGNFLKPVSSLVTAISIFIVALLTGLVVLRFRVVWACLATLLIGTAYFLTAFSFFDNGVVLDMLYPPVVIAGTFTGLNVYNATCMRSEKNEIARTFGRYVSPSVADRILAVSAEGELEMGGEEREVTVAFADVRGFTGISEKTTSPELVRALNAYLAIIIEAVLRYGGMINKFGGDSVMAVWNSPLPCEGHALLAIKAAVSAQSAVRSLQELDKSLLKMEFGIGINTGAALAGNMGSPKRMEYSVIGDAVNCASRITGATPAGKVWIGAETLRQAAHQVVAVPRPPLQVKGKNEPLPAYEVSLIPEGHPEASVEGFDG